MKREAKFLKEKALTSLLLSIDHFNGVSNLGRNEAVLIFLDHSFEMLLKAAILKNDGRIREPREKNTIGFDKCVRKALSDEPRFISNDQALVLQSINGLRDAAQHHLVELSESQLYFHAQSGVTLFRDILKDVFNEEMASVLPTRVLPVSTVVLNDPLEMFSSEVDTVRELLAPGRRKQAEAIAKLRGIAIVDGALQGHLLQPGESELKRLGKRLIDGETLSQVFPGYWIDQFLDGGERPSIESSHFQEGGSPSRCSARGDSGGECDRAQASR